MTPDQEAFQAKISEAREMLSLANTYLYDGALHGGAVRLERAAELFVQAAEIREKAFRRKGKK